MMSFFFLLDFCGGKDDGLVEDDDVDVGVDISLFFCFIKHNIIWYFFLKKK